MQAWKSKKRKWAAIDSYGQCRSRHALISSTCNLTWQMVKNPRYHLNIAEILHMRLYTISHCKKMQHSFFFFSVVVVFLRKFFVVTTAAPQWNPPLKSATSNACQKKNPHLIYANISLLLLPNVQWIPSSLKGFLV